MPREECNENTNPQTWEKTKAMLKEKFIIVNVNIKKEDFKSSI